MKYRFIGKLQYNDEWVDINPEKATFEIPDDKDLFDYFHDIFSSTNYLVTYYPIKE